MSLRALRTFVPLVAFAVAGCGADDSWLGIVYPDRGDLLTHREIGSYSSLADCRAAARAYLRGMNAADAGDFECGKNCRTGDGDLKICEETSR